MVYRIPPSRHAFFSLLLELCDLFLWYVSFFFSLIWNFLLSLENFTQSGKNLGKMILKSLKTCRKTCPFFFLCKITSGVCDFELLWKRSKKPWLWPNFMQVLDLKVLIQVRIGKQILFLPFLFFQILLICWGNLFVLSICLRFEAYKHVEQIFGEKNLVSH